MPLGKSSIANAIEEARYKVNNAGTGTGNATLTVSASTFFSIHNTDEVNSLTLTINSITVTVAPGFVFEDEFDSFTSVSIVATGSYNWYTKA